MAAEGGENAASDEPSSHAPVVAFPDFRLFDSAQDILDHNKRIIKEIKANHETQTPEALARNCLLIRELNINIAAVMRAYARISDSFERYMSQHQGPLPGNLQAVMAQAQQRMQQAQEQMGQEQQPTANGNGNGNGASEAAVPQAPGA